MTRVVLSVVAGVVAWSMAAAAQAPTPAPAAQRLNGIWELNKDLSSKPLASPGDREGRGGDREGGGGGSRRGGMTGGMSGGRMGAGYSRVGAPRGDERERAQVLLQELGQAPEKLIVVSKDGALIVTDGDGVSRHFAIDGKAESVAVAGQTVEVKSTWDNDAIEQEFKLGNGKVDRRIETTTDGRTLLITVAPNGKDRDNPVPPLKFIYNRAG